MRDDKDFLSYKTYVYNFFNSSNFFNFTQVEPAKLELNYKYHFEPQATLTFGRAVPLDFYLGNVV